MQNTWLIFGCSPFVNEIKEEIPALLSKYKTIGLNLFPNFHKKCDYWMINDCGIIKNIVKKNYAEEKLIINEKIEDELLKDRKIIEYQEGRCFVEETPTQKRFFYETFVEADKPVLVKSGKLMFVHSVVLPAINYAILEKAEKIVLIGIDLKSDWKHFYGVQNNYNKPENHIKIIQESIKEFAKFAKIYKANPEANLDLEYKNIKELLVNH